MYLVLAMIELKTMLRKSINNTELKQCRFFNTFLSYYNLFFSFIQTTYLIVFNTQTYTISTVPITTTTSVV